MRLSRRARLRPSLPKSHFPVSPVAGLASFLFFPSLFPFPVYSKFRPSTNNTENGRAGCHLCRGATVQRCFRVALRFTPLTKIRFTYRLNQASVLTHLSLSSNHTALFSELRCFHEQPIARWEWPRRRWRSYPRVGQYPNSHLIVFLPLPGHSSGGLSMLSRHFFPHFSLLIFHTWRFSESFDRA